MELACDRFGWNALPTGTLETSGDVLGKVISEEGQPVPGALVSIYSGSTTTDDNGVFVFRDVKLDGITLYHTNFSGADLAGLDFTPVKAWLVLPRLNFTGANLSGVTLVRAHLNGSIFKEANLQGANLTRSYFDREDFSGANLQGANLSKAVLAEANLRGANLSQTNLSDTAFRAADLSGATLRGAVLTETNLLHTNLTNADLREITLHPAFSNRNPYIDSSAILRGVDLRGADIPKLATTTVIWKALT